MRRWWDAALSLIIIVVSAHIAWRIADPVYLFPIAIPLALCMFGLVKLLGIVAASFVKWLKTG